MFEIPDKASKWLRDALKKINFSIKNSSMSLQLKQKNIQILAKGKEVSIPFIFCDKLSSSNIMPIINYIRHTDDRLILISAYISKQLVEHLVQSNIQFLDFSGNVYLNRPPIYILMTGETPTSRSDKTLEKMTLGTSGNVKKLSEKILFQAAGVKVIFALLCNPGLENKTYRFISLCSDVSLGTVDKIMKGLQDFGYLMNDQDTRIVTNKKKLLHRWCIAFNETLRRTILIGHFTSTDHHWWQKVKIIKHHAQWGGEVAANKLIGYLKPSLVTIYCNNFDPRLQIEYELRRSDIGEIEVLKKFWNFETHQSEKNLVPYILIYADLMSIKDERSIETGQIIYEKYISQFIK